MGYNPSFFSHDGKPAPEGLYSRDKPGGGKDKVKGLDTDDFPVENVSWQDAQEFLEKLNALVAERKFGVTYRLPTEAQWEYACRGGHLFKDRTKAQLPFHFKSPSASLGTGQANFASDHYPYGGGKAGPYLKRPNTVGKNGEPNVLGLYDMHGNAEEWCHDWYETGYYAKSPRLNPAGPDRGSSRVLRGGHWSCRGEGCRAACRSCYWPSQTLNMFGLRVAGVPR
jgi:formylglycine-generating enzyme required for sulfatase activity